ncbi:MAG: hypothetical protein AAFX87_30010 [Bacteroidota bacterium]
MKKHSTKILIIGILVAAIILLASNHQKSSAAASNHAFSYDLHNEALKAEAFEILNTKCNTCHRKQNPFMVFNKKNMEKRASKIYKAVYIQKKMPKGNDIRLTNEEYTTLKKWLFTQNIF